jgi:site-specific DNA-cytosine methylase
VNQSQAASLFLGRSKISKNLQIGNAVPPIFGEVIAKEIMKTL